VTPSEVGSDDRAAAAAPPDGWLDGPANRWWFQRVDEILATAPVPRGGGPPLAFGRAPVELDLGEWPAQSFTDGILVLRGRDVVAEHYRNGMGPATRHLLMSVSKSLCGALVGRLVGEGRVGPESLVSRYVPELAGSAYGDATLRQVLDMTVAVEFGERYEDPESEVQAQDRVAGWRARRAGDPPDSYAFLASLRRSGRHGESFHYCSAGTDVLAWVVERATGRSYASALSEGLWSRLGAERDAFVSVDPAGFAAANGGVCASLRDLARFGRLVLEGGRNAGGEQVVPESWLADLRRGAGPGTADEPGAPHPAGRYRSQWWLTGDDHASFYAAGIYGQYLWLDPAADVAIAKLSSLPAPDDPTSWKEHVARFREICDGLG
jgi:CubicO group peptidase (beta-lactamase class C family)